VQPVFPHLQLIAVRTAERQTIEPRPPLVERLGAVQVRDLGNVKDCAADTPSDATERTCVLVKDGVRAEQTRVPGHTLFKVRNRQRHEGDGRELGHRSTPLRASRTQRTLPP
jgi:hypothetical protein